MQRVSQVATILYEYAAFKGCDMNVYGDLSTFADMGEVSDFAKEPMTWAVAESLISGVAVGREALLDPQGVTTREQFAMMMAEYMMQVLPLTPDEPDEPGCTGCTECAECAGRAQRLTRGAGASPRNPALHLRPARSRLKREAEAVQTPAEGETP